MDDRINTVAILLVAYTFAVGFVFSKGVSGFLSKDYIDSDTIIKPQIKLVIVNNRVDTIYKYKIK